MADLCQRPLGLAGETAATVRLRADLSFAAPAEYLDIGIRRLDTSGNSTTSSSSAARGSSATASNRV